MVFRNIAKYDVRFFFKYRQLLLYIIYYISKSFTTVPLSSVTFIQAVVKEIKLLSALQVKHINRFSPNFQDMFTTKYQKSLGWVFVNSTKTWICRAMHAIHDYYCFLTQSGHPVSKWALFIMVVFKNIEKILCIWKFPWCTTKTSERT